MITLAKHDGGRGTSTARNMPEKDTGNTDTGSMHREVVSYIYQEENMPRMPEFGPKWVRLALNGTNLEILSDRIQYSSVSLKCTESDLKKSPDLSHFGPI